MVNFVYVSRLQNLTKLLFTSSKSIWKHNLNDFIWNKVGLNENTYVENRIFSKIKSQKKKHAPLSDWVTPQVAQARNMSIGEHQHCCVAFKIHTYLYSNRIRLLILFYFYFFNPANLHNILRSHIRGVHLNFKKKNVHEKKFWRNFILDVNVSF